MEPASTNSTAALYFIESGEHAAGNRSAEDKSAATVITAILFA